MKTSPSVLKWRIGGDDLDIRLGRWTCYLGSCTMGLYILMWMTVQLPRDARNGSQLTLGLLAGCLPLVLGVILTRLLGNLLESSRERTLRSRSGIYLSFVANVALAAIAAWQVPRLGFPDKIEAMICILLLLAVVEAVATLGLLSSILRTLKG